MMRRVFTLRNGLIGGFTALVLAFIVLLTLYINTIVSIVQAPSPSSTIVVSKNVTPISVPTEITAGQQFVYKTSGDKLLDVGADVRLQLTCSVAGTDSIVSIATFYSRIPKGHYNVVRTTVIPISQRVTSSETCHLDSISSFTFYQTDNQGVVRPVQIKTSNRSNDFRLIVPDQTTTVTTQTVGVVDSASSPESASDQPDVVASTTPDVAAAPAVKPRSSVDSIPVLGPVLKALGI